MRQPDMSRSSACWLVISIQAAPASPPAGVTPSSLKTAAPPARRGLRVQAVSGLQTGVVSGSTVVSVVSSIAVSSTEVSSTEVSSTEVSTEVSSSVSGSTVVSTKVSSMAVSTEVSTAVSSTAVSGEVSAPVSSVATSAKGSVPSAPLLVSSKTDSSGARAVPLSPPQAAAVMRRQGNSRRAAV